MRGLKTNEYDTLLAFANTSESNCHSNCSIWTERGMTDEARIKSYELGKSVDWNTVALLMKRRLFYQTQCPYLDVVHYWITSTGRLAMHIHSLIQKSIEV